MPHDSHMGFESSFLGHQEAKASTIGEVRQAVIDAAMKFLNKYSFPLRRDGIVLVVDWQMPHRSITSIFSNANEAMFDKVTSDAAKQYVLTPDEAPMLNKLIKQGREEAISVYIALMQDDVQIDQQFISMRNDLGGFEMRPIGRALSPVKLEGDAYPPRCQLQFEI